MNDHGTIISMLCSKTFKINIKMEGQKRKFELRNFRLLKGVCDSRPKM